MFCVGDAMTHHDGQTILIALIIIMCHSERQNMFGWPTVTSLVWQRLFFRSKCLRMPSLPNCGKTHDNEARPDKRRPDRHRWRQTGPALHNPLQHYCATRKQSAGQNSPDIRNNPSPHHRSETPPPRTTDMKHSITIQTRNNKATRSPEISREQVQKLTPQFLLYIYWI